jgi:signal transduction histidine kinase/DNA-binding NarL/FixJ family response regulator
MNDHERHLMRLVEKLQLDKAHLSQRADDESHSRLMAEEALGQTENRLALALDAAGFAMWEWDITNQTVFTSARFDAILNPSPTGQNKERLWRLPELMQLVVRQDRHHVKEAVSQAIKGTGKRFEVEFRLTGPNGPLWIECTGEVSSRSATHRALRMVGINRDVTKRREIQIEIETARAQAEAANAAKDEFLANISHEIRTPLNGVIGLNNLLAQTPLTPEQRKYVELVGSSGRALLALVNDVLDFSRIEAQKIVLEHVRFPLKRWLWEVVTPQRIAAQAKGLELHLQFDEALPCEAVGDPGRLRQVVTNLVNNAIKFTEHGSIEVSMSAGLDATETLELILQVRDTGIGIALEKQQSIFSAFVQADSSTSRRYGGTGLGLSICAKLVQLMQGSIDLFSTQGQGSLFVVHVPLGVADAQTPATNFGLEEDLFPEPTQLPKSEQHLTLSVESIYAGKRALVVDDHQINRLLASKLLQRLGFEVTAVSDGAQALNEVAAQKLDLILMDIQMPQMNGWQATHNIRAWEKKSGRRRVPVVVLSAHASSADREQALAADMDGYLSKPLTPEALAAVLRSTGLAGNSHTTMVPQPTVTTRAQDLTPNNPKVIVNRVRMLQRLAGDSTALHEMAQAFCGDLRERLMGAHQALRHNKWVMLRAQAHALKGALLSITAEHSAKDAVALERAAQAESVERATAAFEALTQSALEVFEVVKGW